jgi:hypothetical protein
MDLHFLGSFVLPEPAMNPGGRRREKTVRVILTDLVVEFVALKVIGTRFCIRLAMEFELNLSRRFPSIHHDRAFLRKATAIFIGRR